MDKITYLAELAEGLARWVPERERQDILRYYAEYFEEAGPGREGEVVAELGDPWALSSRLAVEGGFVTQEAANSWTPPKKKKRSAEIVACVAIVTIVVIVAVASIASNVGRFVGWMVYNTARSDNPAQVEVIEGTDFSIQEAEGITSVPGVIFYEYDGAMEGGGFWSMEDGYLDAFWEIDADISLGNIIVTGGEDYTLAIQYSGNLGGYSVKWELQGDTLKIRDGSSGGHNIGFSELGDVLGKKAVDVIITVPDGSYLRKVDVKTDMGDVHLARFGAEEKVKAETKMGDVDCFEVQTLNKLTLKTNAGDIELGVLSNIYDDMDIEVETDAGDVTVNMDCYARLCAYKLETDLGVVSVNGSSYGTKAEYKGDNTRYRLEAKSDLGDVDVNFLDDRWQ